MNFFSKNRSQSSNANSTDLRKPTPAALKKLCDLPPTSTRRSPLGQHQTPITSNKDKDRKRGKELDPQNFDVVVVAEIQDKLDDASTQYEMELQEFRDGEAVISPRNTIGLKLPERKSHDEISLLRSTDIIELTPYQIESELSSWSSKLEPSLDENLERPLTLDRATRDITESLRKRMELALEEKKQKEMLTLSEKRQRENELLDEEKTESALREKNRSGRVLSEKVNMERTLSDKLKVQRFLYGKKTMLAITNQNRVDSLVSGESALSLSSEWDTDSYDSDEDEFDSDDDETDSDDDDDEALYDEYALENQGKDAWHSDTDGVSDEEDSIADQVEESAVEVALSDGDTLVGPRPKQRWGWNRRRPTMRGARGDVRGPRKFYTVYIKNGPDREAKQGWLGKQMYEIKEDVKMLQTTFGPESLEVLLPKCGSCRDHPYSPVARRRPRLSNHF